MNVDYDMKSGAIICKDCAVKSDYAERTTMNFTEHANEKKQEEFAAIKKEMEGGVEYDVENQTFINVQKQDLD